jgi:hypothetical protein
LRTFQYLQPKGKKKTLKANFMAFNRASQVTERVNPLDWLTVSSPLHINMIKYS